MKRLKRILRKIGSADKHIWGYVTLWMCVEHRISWCEAMKRMKCEREVLVLIKEEDCFMKNRLLKMMRSVLAEVGRNEALTMSGMMKWCIRTYRWGICNSEINKELRYCFFKVKRLWKKKWLTHSKRFLPKWVRTGWKLWNIIASRHKKKRVLFFQESSKKLHPKGLFARGCGFFRVI